MLESRKSWKFVILNGCHQLHIIIAPFIGISLNWHLTLLIQALLSYAFFLESVFEEQVGYMTIVLSRALPFIDFIDSVFSY